MLMLMLTLALVQLIFTFYCDQPVESVTPVNWSSTETNIWTLMVSLETQMNHLDVVGTYRGLWAGISV